MAESKENMTVDDEEEKKIYDETPQNTEITRESVTDDAEIRLMSVCPDVCWTPCGSEMVAIPYNVYVTADECARSARTIRSRGKRVLTLRSIMTTCHGAKPGTGKGVSSKTVGGICEPITGNPTVRAEGAQIVRDGDLFFMNNRNTIGKIRIVRNTKIYKTPAAYSDAYARGKVKLVMADDQENEDA